MLPTGAIGVYILRGAQCLKHTSCGLCLLVAWSDRCYVFLIDASNLVMLDARLVCLPWAWSYVNCRSAAYMYLGTQWLPHWVPLARLELLLNVSAGEYGTGCACPAVPVTGLALRPSPNSRRRVVLSHDVCGHHEMAFQTVSHY